MLERFILMKFFDKGWLDPSQNAVRRHHHALVLATLVRMRIQDPCIHVRLFNTRRTMFSTFIYKMVLEKSRALLFPFFDYYLHIYIILSTDYMIIGELGIYYL